jgi:hypothetical protein
VRESLDLMIPKAPREVNKFDPKMPVLFDRETLRPYKETVISSLLGRAMLDLIASTLLPNVGLAPTTGAAGS